ncbi:MAG: AgmX/PglI C-terminal domain-containing protein [Polyangiaceae bacterium]
MRFDVEKFFTLTVGLALAGACSRQPTPKTAAAQEPQAAAVQVPTPEESEADKSEELVKVVDERPGDASGEGDGADEAYLHAAAEGDSSEEYAVGGLIGGPMLEGYGGLGLSGTGVGGLGTGGGTIGGGSGYVSNRPQPTPLVTGTPLVQGGMDRNALQRVVKRNMNQLRYCYQRELKSGSFDATLKVKFVIGATGRVSSVALTNKSPRPALDACVQGVFRRMVFPKPATGAAAVVTYPIVFRAK